MKLKLNSTQVVVEVEVGVELGNNSCTERVHVYGYCHAIVCSHLLPSFTTYIKMRGDILYYSSPVFLLSLVKLKIIGV